MNWKAIAIALIVLQVLEIAFVSWSVYSTIKDYDNTKICYYETCENYYDAQYDKGVCYCYNKNAEGTDIVLAKTEILD